MSIMLATLFCSLTVYAGDINAAEQSILSTICGTFEYMGSYYKVKSEYISQVADYLSRDSVNLTDSQASSYISQFYANISTGVNGGYMYKVGDVEAEPTPEPTPGQDPTQAPQAPGTVAETETTETVETYSVSTFEARGMYVWDTDRLIVYKEADETSEYIGLLFKGDLVFVTGATTNGWMQVVHNGETGYVDAKYLRTYEYMVEIGEIVVEEESTSEIISSEAVSEEIISAEEVSSEAESSEEASYDYSDATPMKQNVSIGLLAAILCAVVACVGIIIVWIHKKKNFKR